MRKTSREQRFCAFSIVMLWSEDLESWQGVLVLFFFFFLKAEIVALFLHSNLVFGFLLKNWKLWCLELNQCPFRW